MLVTGLVTLSLMLNAATAAAAASGPAEPASWKIVAASGRSEFRTAEAAADSWSPLRRGGSLAPLTTVRTLEKARATFTRQGDLILLDASSEVLLPEITPAGMTVIMQVSGTALYKVAPGSAARRFEVRTPSLVAGVKGTRFTVRMEEGRTAVNVLEGIVEVRSLLTGETRDLGAGEIAVVEGHEGRLEVQQEAPESASRTRGESAPASLESAVEELRSDSKDLDDTLTRETEPILEESGDLWSDLLDEEIALDDSREISLCNTVTRLDQGAQEVKVDTTILKGIPILIRRN